MEPLESLKVLLALGRHLTRSHSVCSIPSSLACSVATVLSGVAPILESAPASSGEEPIVTLLDKNHWGPWVGTGVSPWPA